MMDQALRSRCERFLANRDTLRKAFPWENPYLHAVCAGILTQKNQTAEVDRLHDCRTCSGPARASFPTSGGSPRRQ